MNSGDVPTQNCTEECLGCGEPEDICVDDLPAVVILIHHILILIQIVARKVVLQDSRL